MRGLFVELQNGVQDDTKILAWTSGRIKLLLMRLMPPWGRKIINLILHIRKPKPPKTTITCWRAYNYYVDLGLESRCSDFRVHVLTYYTFIFSGSHYFYLNSICDHWCWTFCEILMTIKIWNTCYYFCLFLNQWVVYPFIAYL